MSEDFDRLSDADAVNTARLTEETSSMSTKKSPVHIGLHKDGLRIDDATLYINADSYLCINANPYFVYTRRPRSCSRNRTHTVYI